MKIDVKEMNEFLNVYIVGSSIKTMAYNVLSEKWQLIFNDNTFLDFDSFDDMTEWLHYDQHGD